MSASIGITNKLLLAPVTRYAMMHVRRVIGKIVSSFLRQAGVVNAKKSLRKGACREKFVTGTMSNIPYQNFSQHATTVNISVRPEKLSVLLASIRTL